MEQQPLPQPINTVPVILHAGSKKFMVLAVALILILLVLFLVFLLKKSKKNDNTLIPLPTNSVLSPTSMILLPTKMVSQIKGPQPTFLPTPIRSGNPPLSPIVPFQGGYDNGDGPQSNVH